MPDRAMMPDYRILALDIDGTLVDAAGELPAAHGEALAEARRRGLEVVLVTGRGWTGTRPLYQALSLKEPAVLFSGAQVVDSTGRAILERRIDPGDAVTLAAFAEAHRFSLVACVDAESALASRRADDFGPWQIWAPDVPVVGDLTPYLSDHPPLFLNAYGRRAAQAFMAAFPTGLPETRWELWDPRPEERVLFWWHRAADKAVALEWLCSRLGYGPGAVVAMGDHAIDLPMLRWARTSVAMAHAPETVRQACTLVAESGDPAPVATALRWLGIIA